MFNLIEQTIYPSITPPENAKVLGGRKTVIAGQPGVEFIALFELPDLGIISARIVGVFVPNSPHALIMIQQSSNAQMPLDGPDAMGGTFAGEILNSVTFQAYRGEDGALVRY